MTAGALSESCAGAASHLHNPPPRFSDSFGFIFLATKRLATLLATCCKRVWRRKLLDSHPDQEQLGFPRRSCCHSHRNHSAERLVMCSPCSVILKGVIHGRHSSHYAVDLIAIESSNRHQSSEGQSQDPRAKFFLISNGLLSHHRQRYPRQALHCLLDLV